MWFQIVNIGLGIWLLFAPTLLPATGPGAGVDRIVGPVVIWVGVLAMRGVTRSFRVLNVLSGMALAIAPWVVSNTTALQVASVLTGWAVIVLSIPRGAKKHEVGRGWEALLQPERLPT